jgi:hypothetical protein
MAWGKKGKDIGKEAAERLAALEKTLIARFRDATRGVSCRTHAYKTPDIETADHEWLEAHRVGIGHWIVLHRNERDPRAAILRHDGVVVRQQVMGGCEKLTFYEAVKKLAEYEAMQKDSGQSQIAAPSAEQMGREYYKTLATLEGLAFDITNAPHPTLEGRIVTAGNFSREAFDSVQKALDDARAEVQARTSRMLQDSLLGDFNPASNPKLFDDYLFASQLLGALKNVREALTLGAANGFHVNQTGRRVEHDRDRAVWSFNDGSHWNHDLRTLIDDKLFRGLKSLTDSYFPAESDETGTALRGFARQATEIAQFYSAWVMARRAMKDMNATGAQDGGKITADNVRRLADEAEFRLTLLGGSEADAKLLRAALMRGDEGALALPEGLDALIAQAEKICAAIREAKSGESIPGLERPRLLGGLSGKKALPPPQPEPPQ